MTTNNGLIKGSQMIELEGRGSLKISPTIHVTTGGEGSIYRPSPDTIIKIYSDPNKMLRDGMAEKIKLLTNIKHPFIVSPIGLVYRNQTPIGYYMRFESGEPLPRVFTNTFRQRMNFGNTEAIKLVDSMELVIHEAHKNKALLIDANEFNWLVKLEKGKVEPRIIDVDSWSIGRFKPSVIMPSIKDWHTNGFNEGTDWFSFAIVSFQIFTGIHPYKGTLAPFKMNDIESRMRANKSVFTPGVQLNNAVRDFSSIPSPILEWYEAVFQNTERSAPPLASLKGGIGSSIRQTKKITITANTALIFDLLLESTIDPPIEIFPCGVVRLSSGKLINLENKKEFSVQTNLPCQIISTDFGYLLVELESSAEVKATLLDRNGKNSIALNTNLSGTKIVRYQNRVFIVNQSGLVEVTVKDYGKPMLISLNSWQLMHNSTRWYDGIGVQDALGAIYLITPFGEGSCQYIRTRELDGKKIVDGFSGSRYASVTILDSKSGMYKQFEFIFDKEYRSYEFRSKDISSPNINTSILWKGVMATISDNDELIVEVPTKNEQKILTDSRIDSNYILSNWRDRVIAIRDRKIYSISMK